MQRKYWIFPNRCMEMIAYLLIQKICFIIGTPIPKGLHVRHDFVSGVTEAKLLDEADEVKEDDESVNKSNSNSLTLHPDKSVLTTEEKDSVKIKKESESVKFPIDELKARLKKLKQKETEDASSIKVTIFFGQ